MHCGGIALASKIKRLESRKTRAIRNTIAGVGSREWRRLLREKNLNLNSNQNEAANLIITVIFLYDRYKNKTCTRLSSCLLAFLVSFTITLRIKVRGFYIAYFPPRSMPPAYINILVVLYRRGGQTYNFLFHFTKNKIFFTRLLLFLSANDSPARNKRKNKNHH